MVEKVPSHKPKNRSDDSNRKLESKEESHYFGVEWVDRSKGGRMAAAAAGKNAVIKGSFPFVMQTYDRPTLTPLSLSLSSLFCRSPLLRRRKERRSRLPLSGVERERTKLAVCTLRGNNRRTRRNKHRYYLRLQRGMKEGPSEIFMMPYIQQREW